MGQAFLRLRKGSLPHSAKQHCGQCSLALPLPAAAFCLWRVQRAEIEPRPNLFMESALWACCKATGAALRALHLLRLTAKPDCAFTAVHAGRCT